MALLCGGIGFLVMWVGGIYAGIDLPWAALVSWLLVGKVGNK